MDFVFRAELVGLPRDRWSRVCARCEASERSHKSNSDNHFECLTFDTRDHLTPCGLPMCGFEFLSRQFCDVAADFLKGANRGAVRQLNWGNELGAFGHKVKFVLTAGLLPVLCEI